MTAEVPTLLQVVEEKLAFPANQDRLNELAQRKKRILTVQNGSRRDAALSKPARIHEGSLRALWKERHAKAMEARHVEQVCCTPGRA